MSQEAECQKPYSIMAEEIGEIEMIPVTIDIKEAQTRFSELISSVESGSEIILTKDDSPVARLVPLSITVSKRIAGLHPGSSWLSPDFNQPLPESFWTGEE